MTGQTVAIALDQDEKFDIFVTLTDILTRRAVFHIERADKSERTTRSIANEIKKELEYAFNFTSRELGIKEYMLIFVVLVSWVVVVMLYFEYKRYKKAKK